MRKKTFIKLAKYQAEQSRVHLEEVRSIHSEMRGYKHDFHHHLQTLKGQLEAGETERALEYIDSLDGALMNVDTLIKTGNVSLDAIMSAKISQAKSENISINIKATVPEELDITDVELSIIVGNLLENAVEAAKNSLGERFIRIYMAMKGNMLYFSMLNSSGKKQIKSSGIFSSKKDGLHGFGLRRAESIIKDHGGWLKYNSEEGAFTSEFLVPAIK